MNIFPNPNPEIILEVGVEDLPQNIRYLRLEDLQLGLQVLLRQGNLGMMRLAKQEGKKERYLVRLQESKLEGSHDPQSHPPHNPSQNVKIKESFGLKCQIVCKYYLTGKTGRTCYSYSNNKIIKGGEIAPLHFTHPHLFPLPSRERIRNRGLYFIAR